MALNTLIKFYISEILFANTVRLVLTFLLMLFLSGCKSSSKESSIDDSYTLLETNLPNEYTKHKVYLNLLINQSHSPEEYNIVQILSIFKKAVEKECKSRNCGNLSIWDNKSAYELNKNEPKSITYQEANKIKVQIAEHYVAEYSVRYRFLLVYPNMDVSYPSYGGKLKQMYTRENNVDLTSLDLSDSR